jgi:hypothetical protein
MKWIHRLYIFFLGIILSITTGFGIAAFYPEPQMPMYPISRVKPSKVIPESCTATPENSRSEACKQYFEEDEMERQKDVEAQQQYEVELREYSNTNAGYTRTAIFFGIAIGSLVAIAGLIVIKTSKLIATGLLLAGVITAVFTRLLIKLASLGSSVTGTEGANTLGYVEFFILLILSAAVIYVGFSTLKEEPAVKS